MNSNNQRGSVSIPMALCIFLITSLVIFLNFNAKSKLEETREITKHYLCLKQGVRLSKNITQRLGRTNFHIRTLHYASRASVVFAPKSTIGLERAIWALQRYQDYLQISYFKSLLTLSHCRIDLGLQFNLLNPYKQFERNSDRTLKVRNTKEWNFYYINFSHRHQKKLRRTFLRVSLRNRFSSIQYQKLRPNHFFY